MYRRPTRKKEVLQRISVYTLMTVFVVGLVTLTIFIILGYRIDIHSGHVERNALVQFDGVPSGAKIAIDGENISKQLPAKQLIVEGQHMFRVSKDGYQPWDKSVMTRADTVTWLNYIRLVPLAPQSEIVSQKTPLVASILAPKNQRIVTQESISKPQLTVYDLRSTKPEVTTAVIPDTAITRWSDKTLTHQFDLKYIDEQGRYALVRHDVQDIREWLIVDLNDSTKTVNVSTRLSIAIQDTQFAGTNGSLLYALIDGKIRKLDLSNDTISRALVESVESFKVKSSNQVVFTGTQDNGSVRIAGIYRDGDSRATTLASADAKQVTKLIVDTARYINEDYLFVLKDMSLEIYKGRLPSPDDSFLGTVSIIKSAVLTQSPTIAGFSPTGQYMYAMSDTSVYSYDTEYATESIFAREGVYTWIDAAHMSVVKDGALFMLDFDGMNKQRIVAADAISGSILSNDGKNIYSFIKTADSYELQRTSLVVN